MEEYNKPPEILVEAGATFKMILGATKSQFGILTIINNGRMANIVAGDGETLKNQERLGAVLREIQEKIGEMAAQAEEGGLEIDPAGGDQSFVKDEGDGEYHPGSFSA